MVKESKAWEAAEAYCNQLGDYTYCTVYSVQLHNTFKGIVSRDFDGLQMILIDRT